MIGDIHAVAGAYALDALDDLERAAFARHIAQCEPCAIELAEFRETVARLADGAWSVPPPRLRTDVLGRIARTRQLPPATPSAGLNTGATLSQWRRGAAAAAVAGILATGAAATYGIQEQRVQRQEAIAEAARAQTARIQAVLSSPDVRLRTAVLRTGGRVTVAISAVRDSAVVALTAPPAGPNRVYQFWLIDGTTATSAAVLAADERDTTRLIGGVRNMDTFGITVEPVGGSSSPTLATATTLPMT